MKKELNIVGHGLVPKHIKLNEDEKKELLEKYNISLTQLPKIYDSDPMIKLMENVKIGDIVKIERNSPTAGIGIFYRVVVHG